MRAEKRKCQGFAGLIDPRNEVSNHRHFFLLKHERAGNTYGEYSRRTHVGPTMASGLSLA